MKRIVLFGLLMTVMSLLAKANDSSFSASGNQLVPATETEISVKKEILSLKLVGNKMKVDVYYEFYNPTKSSKNLIVGFEAPSPYDGGLEVDPHHVTKKQPFIHKFTVNMNDRPLAHKIALIKHEYDEEYNAKSQSFKNGQPNGMSQAEIKAAITKMINEGVEYELDFYYVYYFNAVFKPGINIIKHSYEYDCSSSAMARWSFPYRLTPACKWANGQIDDFTLIVDMGPFASYSIPETFTTKEDKWKIIGSGKVTYEEEGMLAMPERNFVIRDGYAMFQKKNFKPESELEIYKPFNSTWGENLLEQYQYGPFLDLGVELAQFKDEEQLSYFGIKSLSEIKSIDAKILKNLPFAYRGYVFKTKELQEFYNKANWYIPNPNYVNDLNTLTKDEKEWVLFWAKVEKQNN